ncbi:MAG: hypothetical protein WC341_09985 [Bacteroidales bacterium]|jgi:hypothetical protein
MAKSEYGVEYSKEIIAFKEDFEASTNLKVYGIREHPNYFEWKRLVLGELNADQMIVVAEYLRTRFYTKGKFTHLSPKIHSYDDRLVLTVDEEDIQKFILNKKKRTTLR